LVQNKVVVCKNFHIQPSELECMPYWEYEMTLQECQKIADEEKKQEENQGGAGAESYSKYRKQTESMMKGPRMPSVPKMPSMPRMPSIPSSGFPKI